MQFSIILFLCLFLGVHTKQARPDPISYTTVDILHVVRYQTTADWTKKSFSLDKKREIEVVNYQRVPIDTDSNKQYIPTQSCKVEKMSPTDIKTYSLSSLKIFQQKRDFKILKTITHTDGLLQLTYAIGYWATYTDEANVPHKLIIVHGIHPNGKGLQFFIDCPNVIFPILEEEITAQIRSLTFI
jgi:hypothetical protein